MTTTLTHGSVTVPPALAADPIGAGSTCTHGDGSHERVFNRVRMSVFAGITRREGMPAVMNLVDGVGSSGIPPKVLQSIIGRVSVVMARLHSVWSGSNKRGQHSNVPFYVTPSNEVVAIPALLADCACEDAPSDPSAKSISSLQPSDLSIGGYLIAVESGDVPPFHIDNPTNQFIIT